MRAPSDKATCVPVSKKAPRNLKKGHSCQKGPAPRSGCERSGGEVQRKCQDLHRGRRDRADTVARILQAIHIDGESSSVRGQNSPGGHAKSARCVRGRRMSLWWLSFQGGTTIIVRAETLVHARLLAVADEVVRAHPVRRRVSGGPRVRANDPRQSNRAHTVGR